MHTQTESGAGSSVVTTSITPKVNRHARNNASDAARRSPSQMFDLEDVIRTSYGFDFFMRHLVKEFCHENLLSFYEMEKFQEVVLAELQIQYSGTYNDVQALVMIGFPTDLPKPYILTYPIEVQVVLLDEQTGAVINEAPKTDEEENKEKKREFSVTKQRRL